MVINKHLQIIISLCLFIGVLWTGQTLGLWQLKAAEIGGDTLIIEVSKRYGIPLETIYETWNIPAHISPRAELAEARDEAGFSIGRFRVWVTAYVKEHNLLAAAAGLAELDKLDEAAADDTELNVTGAITLRQISYYFGIPIEEFCRKFSLPQETPPDTTIRALREEYDIELGEIIVWLRIRSDGIPYYNAVQSGKPLDPDHLREWMTLEQASHAAGVPLDFIYSREELSPHLQVEKTMTLGELKEYTGFTLQDMRSAISEYRFLNPDAPIIAQAPPATSFGEQGMGERLEQELRLGESLEQRLGQEQGLDQEQRLDEDSGLGDSRSSRENSGNSTQQEQENRINLQGSRSIETDGIRAVNTIDEICRHYNISPSWLMEKLDLHADTPGSSSLRSLEIEVGRVRTVIEEHEGLS